MRGMLYIVATPIGNLGDISDRAKETLKQVDLILCEDNRVIRKLLSAFEIKTSTESVHQHSADAKLDHVIERLRKGMNMALVTDAGTPGISDPGGKLVALAIANHVTIVPIPGVSAVTAALSASGFPAEHFTFLGFPPHKKGRVTFFKEADEIEHTVVIFESKHRIVKALEQISQDRLMMIGREITKMHETFYRGTAPEILKQIEATSDKGEFVIVLAPKKFQSTKA